MQTIFCTERDGCFEPSLPGIDLCLGHAGSYVQALLMLVLAEQHDAKEIPVRMLIRLFELYLARASWNLEHSEPKEELVEEMACCR